VTAGDDEGFVSWVLQFGEDAVVRAPERIRQAVVRRLRAAAKPAAATSKRKTNTKQPPRTRVRSK
jgi:predicted DNA-binding transcriptional regulator YafY